MIPGAGRGPGGCVDEPTLATERLGERRRARRRVRLGRLEDRGFVAGAVHDYGQSPEALTQKPPRQFGYRSLIQLAGADAAKAEAREQASAAFEPRPNEPCATGRRVTVTGIPDATGADSSATRAVSVATSTSSSSQGGPRGTGVGVSVKKGLEDRITAAAQELYDSIQSEGT